MSEAPESSERPESPERPVEDDGHRRFRQALERKQAKSASPDRGQPSNGKSLGHSSDNRKRQFRRKSGG